MSGLERLDDVLARELYILAHELRKTARTLNNLSVQLIKERKERDLTTLGGMDRDAPTAVADHTK